MIATKNIKACEGYDAPFHDIVVIIKRLNVQKDLVGFYRNVSMQALTPFLFILFSSFDVPFIIVAVLTTCC